jgi:hypothetical protein
MFTGSQPDEGLPANDRRHGHFIWIVAAFSFHCPSDLHNFVEGDFV